MARFFTMTQDGQELHYHDSEDTEASSLGHLGDVAEVYTTYSNCNASRIVDYYQRNYSVAACSDLAIGCVADNAAQPHAAVLMGKSLASQRMRCIEHGGYRLLHEVDILHLTLSAQQQVADFLYSPQYFQTLAKQSWVKNHPLLPVLEFLGLDVVYSVLTLSSWVDYRRFNITSNPAVSTQLFNSYMCCNDMTPGTLAAICRTGPLVTLNTPCTPPSVRRWLLAASSWTTTFLAESGFKPLQQLSNQLEAVSRFRKNSATRRHEVTVNLTNLVIAYLWEHHRCYQSEGRYRFNPYEFFKDHTELAQEYNRTFLPRGK
jgi:hypothetical protein